MARADNFDRANAALGGSTPSDGGATWTTAGVGANIVSNQVKWTSAAAPGLNLLEASGADGTVSATIVNTGDTTLGRTSGLAFRYADTSNYWFATVEWITPRLGLFKRVAGTSSQVGSYYTGAALTAGAVLSVEFVGDQITVKLDGVAVIGPQTDSALQTNTKVGLRSNNDQTAIYDDFAFTEPSTDAITIDEQAQRVYQRTWSTDEASVTISGTYSGSPTAIEYRIIAHVGGATVVDWTTLDASPTGGTYSEAVDVPAGGMYIAETRFSNDTGITESQADQWGVGDLIAFTGQSNARNCFASTGTAYGTLLWFWSSTTSTHTPTAEWKQLTTDCNGAEGFGDAWIAATGVPVGFLDTGVGSSSAASWQGGQTNYEAFEAAADANGSSVAAIVYWQGEAEAGGTPSESGYEDDLYNDANSVIKQPRIDLANPTTAAQIPFVLILLGRNDTLTDANAQTIRNAQIDVADAAPGVYRVTIHDLTLQDTIHYTTTSYPLACARAAQAALYALGEATYHRGPQINFAVQVDSTTVDVYLTHDGGTDISPSTGINGFELFDDASPMTLSSVVRHASNRVRITTSAPIAGTLTLRHFYGKDGGVTFANSYSNALKDNSALALPAENAESITVTTAPTGGLLTAMVLHGAYI